MFIEFKPTNQDQRIPTYLIEKNGNEYIIHRKLIVGERSYYESSRLMAYDNELYLKNIETVSSYNEATAFIENLWPKSAEVFSTN